MFRKISLKIKLIGAFIIITVALATLSFFNIQAIDTTRLAFADIVENHMTRLNTLQDMRVIAARFDKATSLYESGAGGASGTEQQKSTLLTDLEKLAEHEKTYQMLMAQVEDIKEREEIERAFKPVATAKEQTVVAVSELVALKEQRAPASAIAAKGQELAKAEVTLEHTISTTIDQNVTAVEEENEKIKAHVVQITLFSILFSAGTGLFAIVIGLIIAISVGRNVDRLKVGAAKLAGGDFSSHIDIASQDELGQLATTFNKMAASLRSSYLRLALEKERDETLLESMTEGMVALDEQAKIVLINSVATEMLGLEAKPGNVLFNEKVQLLTQEGKPTTAETLPTSTLKTGEAMDNVYTFQKDSTHKVLFNISASAIKLEGHIAGAILVLRDVTKEKEVDRMKTEFISLASHQLRTPLSAIKWFSEMLLNGDAGELKPEQKDFTKNISDSTDRMVQLVNSLLNISRIESGRIIVDPHPTDLKELITGIVNDLKAKTEERQQTLIISVHSDLPKINLDPRLIGQVYLNLLTNAVKYTPRKGEISVLVSKKGNDVISQVTDNGYGIPKEQQKRIFQKFFRAENVAKVETDGTGLGLYLIKAIVESSGGKIWFESEENKGTSFWFTIPLSGMKAKEGEVTLDG